MSHGNPGAPSKIVHCHKISQMTTGGRSADKLGQVNLFITEGDRRKEKKWLFDSTVDATRFVRLIQAVNSCGRQIRDAFIELDARGTGHISAEDLQKFSRALPGETLERMVAFAAHAAPLEFLLEGSHLPRCRHVQRVHQPRRPQLHGWP